MTIKYYYHFVVNEIWNQAILPYNLPLTVSVGLFTVYWILCLLGAVGIDSFDIDLDTNVDSNVPTPVASFLRFVNAADVPLMGVLSLLSTFMWVISTSANYYFNQAQTEWLGLTIFIVSLIVSVILVKITTIPLVPIFRKMKNLEKAEPAVGRTASVVSIEVDAKYGQCEQKRTAGAPAILNCITTEDNPIPRGKEVVVVSYDKDKGVYKVRTL